MSPYRTTNDLFQDVKALYDHGDFAGALALTESEAPNLPEGVWEITFWRMCFYSLLGDTDTTIRLLGEALDRGQWYAESMLRGDSDLANVQQVPEFEALLAINAERVATAQAAVKREMRVLVPSGSVETPYKTLIALHGNNSNPERSMQYWRAASEHGWLVALPQSTQVGGSDSFIWNDRAWAARDVTGYHETLRAEHPVDETRIVLGGFSRGAEAACWLTLTDTIPACGFLAVSPFIPDIDAWSEHIAASAKRAVRGYITIGDADTMCYQSVVPLHEKLLSAGVACELRVYPGLDHDYPPGFDQVLSKALDFIEG